MKPFRDIFQRFFQETEPSPQAVGRVRERVQRQDSDAEICRAVLCHLPEPDGGAQARVRARLAARQPAGTGRAWRYAGVAVAAAAAGIGVVLVLPDPGAAPMQAALASADARAELNPSPEVALAYVGTGSLAGTRQAPRILWEAGTVHVEVEPEQGIQLVVDTPEASVQVVGTAFDVTRDALGTEVVVDHGRVRVRCLGGEAVMLGDAESTTCLPTTAHGMLARARELQDHGAAPELLLATADAALERHPQASPLRNELQLVRIEALARLERDVEALEQAQAYLAAGTSQRRLEVLDLATRLAYQVGGCDAALPHFEALAELAPSVPSLVKLADCQAHDPAAARQALEQARELGPDDSWAAAIEARLDRL